MFVHCLISCGQVYLHMRKFQRLLIHILRQFYEVFVGFGVIFCENLRSIAERNVLLNLLHVHQPIILHHVKYFDALVLFHTLSKLIPLW